MMMFQFSAGHPWIQVDGVAPDKPLDSAVLSRLKQFSAMNKLKKMALRVSFFSYHITLSHESICFQFGIVKLCSCNIFHNLSMQVIAENLSEEEIYGLKELFKMIDTDNSGQITFEKLKAGLKMFGANLGESEIFDLLQAVSIS
jgi:calcium-dependent protein kinase